LYCSIIVIFLSVECFACTKMAGRAKKVIKRRCRMMGELIVVMFLCLINNTKEAKIFQPVT
jgi:hypothetical protein